MEEYILLIDTEDAKGLVYNISKVLFANNLNIEQNAEYVDPDTKKFFMRSIISGKVSHNMLLKELKEVLPSSAQIRLNKKEKKDVVILATKESHVLGDLLIRYIAVEKSGLIVIERFKYLQNFIDMPIILSMFLIGVVMVIIAVFVTITFGKTCCIKTGGIGIVLTVMAVLLNVGLNNTVYYPSTSDLQSSLTIMNSSGSHYTLMTMSYVSLMVPFVLAYITYAWYSMDKVKITKEEIESKDSHNY